MDANETIYDYETRRFDARPGFDPMLNCRQVTRLVSQSMDANLRWYQSLGIRLHLLYCVWCRRYAAQLQFLRKASKELALEVDAVPSHALSTEARDTIRARLREASRNDPPPSNKSL